MRKSPTVKEYIKGGVMYRRVITSLGVSVDIAVTIPGRIDHDDARRWMPSVRELHDTIMERVEESYIPF